MTFTEVRDSTKERELDDLLQIGAPAEPSDFVSFWKGTYEEARTVPLNITLREIDRLEKGYRVYEVEYDSFGGFRTGGWITVPEDGHPSIGLVVGHGYGGREGPDPASTALPAVRIFPCARGFDRSAKNGIPANGQQHVITGIELRESYIHRGCVAEVWGAVSVLEELFPDVRGRTGYIGGSFGGGIGAMAIPWDARIRRAFLDVPSFGNHPLRVQIPCSGSGESVREYFRRQPAVLDVLGYYDAATAASHIAVPVFVAAALADPAVPPPGQFAVYNAIHFPDKKLYVRKTGHPCMVSDERALRPLVEDWFRPLETDIPTDQTV